MVALLIVVAVVVGAVFAFSPVVSAYEEVITDPNHPEFLGECPDCGCFLSVSFGQLICQYCAKEEREADEYRWHLDDVRNTIRDSAITASGLWRSLASRAADVEIHVDHAKVVEVDYLLSAQHYGEEFLGVAPDADVLCLATAAIQHDESVMGQTTFAKVVGWEG